MKTLFSVKNETGEEWPAFGMARLGAVLRYDGVNDDAPLYALIKPDGEVGIYVVNGAAPLATAKEGTGIHYLDAQYVWVNGTTVGVGTSVGSTADKWEATDETDNGAQFQSLDEKNDADVATVVSVASAGTSSSSSSVCPCFCLEAGDILVNGIETTAHWNIKMANEVFQQEFGSITFPQGEYLLEKNPSADEWTLDIGAFLTSAYTSGVSATVATTMDGTLTMGFDPYGGLYVTLCVDGEVPEEVV